MRNYLFLKLKDPTILVILVVALFVTFLNNNRKMWNWGNDGQIIEWDVKSYYAYLPATIIHNDLTLDFTKAAPQEYIKNYWPGTAPNGSKVIVTSMGLAFLYLPFFLIGHAWALAGGYVADGYSVPYQIMLQFSVLFYLIIGLILLRKVLLLYFSKTATTLGLLAVVIGTNLLHYLTAEAPMSHGYSFSLYAALFYFTHKWWEKQTIGRTIIIGLLMGLISLIRPTNILVVLFFGFYGVTSIRELGQRFVFFLKEWQYVLIFGLCGLLVWTPQMVYWKFLTGNWFYFSYGNDAGFFFSNPHITDGLFSYRKGWFVYTPIMLFAILGLVTTYKHYRKQFFSITLFVVANVYVILSWWNWWYGGGFGQRAMIESYAFLAFPLTALIAKGISIKRYIKVTTIALTVLLTAHGLFQNFQYYYGAIHWDSMTKEAYWLQFGRLHKHPMLSKYLVRLDNSKAKQGIYVPERNMATTVVNELSCDMESLSADAGKYLSNQEGILLDGGKAQSTEKSRSGSHSVKTGKSAMYALAHRFGVKVGDTYEVSIWRDRNAPTEAVLTMSSPDPKKFFLAAKEPIETDGDWERIAYTLKINKDYPDSLLVVFVMNTTGKDAYFDDYSLKKIE